MRHSTILGATLGCGIIFVTIIICTQPENDQKSKEMIMKMPNHGYLTYDPENNGDNLAEDILDDNDESLIGKPRLQHLNPTPKLHNDTIVNKTYTPTSNYQTSTKAIMKSKRYKGSAYLKILQDTVDHVENQQKFTNEIFNILSNEKMIKDMSKLQYNRLTDFVSQRDSKPPNNLLKPLNQVNMDSLKPFIPKQFVHFDLKGAPPKINYFKYLLKLCRHYGAEGILLEYEDMFPWKRELSVLRSAHAYSDVELQDILSYAKSLELKVIPLIQSFGHMEFVLKHKNFSHLRINGHDVRSLSPMANGSLALVKNMIDQIVEFHVDDIEWLHLGGDEVYDLGRCFRCPEKGKPPAFLYKYHMKPVLMYAGAKINAQGQHVKPIIWDDMIRSFSVQDMQEFGEYTSIMVWNYVPNIEGALRTEMWYEYNYTFENVWLASAFKGANGDNKNFVKIDDRIANHLNWLNRAKYLNDNGIIIEGVILTGWSRFSHLQPICETFPAGIPSLAICLQLGKSSTPKENVISDISKELGFNQMINIYSNGFELPVKTGNFTGNDVYFLSWVIEFREWLMRRRDRTKLKEYAQSGLQNISPDDFNKTLSQYFFQDTVKELLNKKVLVNYRILNTKLQNSGREIRNNNQGNYFDKRQSKDNISRKYPLEIKLYKQKRNRLLRERSRYGTG